MLVESVGKRCCGCNLCISVCPKCAISLRYNEKGFWYPHTDSRKCVDCGRCLKLCPVENKFKRLQYKEKVYIAKNLNDNVRLNSSSGGIFNALAKTILNSGGYVVGVAFDDDYCSVRHIAIDNDSELYRVQGSKYVQSFVDPEMYEMMIELIKKGKTVLYSGTPCQINAVRKLVPEQTPNFYTVDIVCHGVPSPMAWKKYVEDMESKYNDTVKEACFRAKPHGWKRFEMMLKFSKSTYSKWFNKDNYGKSFINNIFLRECCYDCQFKSFPRNADISLGDFWKVREQYDDDKGTSLLIVNTEKGEQLLQSTKHRISVADTNIADAYPGNYALQSSSERFEKREQAFDMLIKDQKSFSEVVENVTHVPFLNKVINKLRSYM